MFHPRNNELLEKARELRKNMTEEEKKLWFGFLRKHSLRFRRQEIIGSYIVDFYCKERKLVIEIDGAQHYEHEAAEYDRKRTEYLEAIGMKVIRVRNGQINKEFENVCRYINGFIDKRE